ncbi:hypothetical protein AC249_AIPGENE3610 [Exaiptasia diaphana]|nr:hypothetical protein AC249_AIPGENE3610 [Exaiptasia diaphana]
MKHPEAEKERLLLSPPPEDTVKTGLSQSMPYSKSKSSLSKTKEMNSDESPAKNDSGCEDDQVEVIQDSLPLDDSPEKVDGVLKVACRGSSFHVLPLFVLIIYSY